LDVIAEKLGVSKEQCSSVIQNIKVKKVSIKQEGGATNDINAI